METGITTYERVGLPWKHVYLHSTGPLKEAASCESVAVGGDDGVL